MAGKLSEIFRLIRALLAFFAREYRIPKILMSQITKKSRSMERGE